MKMNRSIFKDNWHRLFLIIVPFVVAGCLLICTGHGLHFDMLNPVWNDEMGWWTQIDATKAYGAPLGFNGYDATHAQIGTFGPWGATINYPYALFALLFGWSLHSMAIANMFYLGIALFVYSVLAKTTIKQTGWMIILYLCCFITIGYSFTSMAEGVRYSFGLMLAGLVVYYERKTRNGNFCLNAKNIIGFVCTFLFLLFAINMYLIFALYIPVFCWLILRRKNIWLKLSVTFVATLLISAGEQVVVSMLSAPYTLSQSVFDRWYTILQEKGFYAMIGNMVKGTFNNLETINPVTVFQMSDHTLLLYFLSYIVTMVVSVINCFRNRSLANCFIVYLLIGFLLGYCVLYTGSDWTLCRGTNTAFFISVMLLCNCELEKKSNLRIWIIGVSVLGMVQMWNYYTALIKERVVYSLNESAIVEEKKVLDGLMNISPENDKWENTIAFYGPSDYGYLSIPTGAGINWMYSGKKNEKAKYVLIRTNSDSTEKYIDENVNSGHSMIHQDEMFIVLERYD